MVIGEAELGIGPASGGGGTVRDRIALGVAPWFEFARTWHYRDLSTRSLTPFTDGGPNWIWDRVNLSLLWRQLGPDYPHRFMTLSLKCLLMTVAGIGLVLATVVRVFRSRRRARLWAMVLGSLALTVWPRVEVQKTRGAAHSPVTWLGVGTIRTGSDAMVARALVDGVVRRIDDWRDLDQVVVGWRTEPFKKTARSFIGWPGAWYTRMEYPVCSEGPAGEREGFAFAPGGVIQFRKLVSTKLIDHSISLPSIAESLAPVFLAASVPISCWILWRTRVARRRAAKSCCVTCGYRIS